MAGADVRERVNEFVDWAISTGVERGRANGHYRSIGTELVERASGGRVTESHILRVSDAYADNPDLQAIVEEVGDAMLRFEDLRKTGKITPQHLRSSEAETVERRPVSAEEARARAPSPAPKVPTTTPTTIQARPVSASTSGSPVKAGGTQFRCPKCKVMVVANDAGRCPRCGGEPPHVIAAPPEEPRKPVSRMWIRALVAAVLLAGAIFVLTRIRSSVIERRAPGEAVTAWRGDDIGATFRFPPGWRHLPGDATIDDTRNAQMFGDHPLAFDPAPLHMAPLHTATFYRGTAPPRETSRLVVGYTPMGTGLTGDDRLTDIASRLATAIQRRTGDPACVPVDLPPRVARCTAPVEGGHIATYAWTQKDGVGLAAFFNAGPAATTETEGDALIATVQPD